MKTFILSVLILAIESNAYCQDANPKWISIRMIGHSNKPILDLVIIDSARKLDVNFDRDFTIFLYSATTTLAGIYDQFKDEKRFDSLKKYDLPFGTFLFVATLENEKTFVLSNRVQSAVILQRIICYLSNKNDDELLILKEIRNRLNIINK